jgi:ABC-type transport system substrate-binding protein
MDAASVGGAGAGTATTGPSLQAVFDSLVTTDPKTGKQLPRVATKWVADPTGLIWTITLRSGVKFGDGSPFDAPR